MDDEILRVLGARKQDQFYLCSTRAEAINSALFSYYFDHVRKTGQNHILSTQIEDPPFLLSLKRLEEFGCLPKLIAPNAQGQITRELIEQHLRPRTGLLSLSWAHLLTGVIHPIADIAELCRERGVLLHVDASHVLGNLYFRIEDIPVDIFTFGIPQGGAGVILDHKMAYTPLILGAFQDSTPLVHALEQSMRLCDHMCLEIARLRDKLEREVKKAIPSATVCFEHAERLPHISALNFPGVHSEALAFLLQRKSIHAVQVADSTISFQLSASTTEAEIDRMLETLITAVLRLRSYSMQVVP